MTEVIPGQLNGLSHGFKSKFKDFRLVVVKLPLDLVRAVGMRAQFEEMSVQAWITQALERELELESSADWLGLDSPRPEVDEDDLDA